MKRMIGLLMLAGLVVDVVGCGDDDNPVKSSNEDLLVGSWVNEYDQLFIFRPDGTFVNGDYKGTWSLAGDQLTMTYSDGSVIGGTVTVTVTDTELTLTIQGGLKAVYTRQT